MSRLLNAAGWTTGHVFASVSGLADVEVAKADVIVMVESAPGHLGGATTQKVVSTLRWVFPDVAAIVVPNSDTTLLEADQRLKVLTRVATVSEIGGAITNLSGAAPKVPPVLPSRPRQVLELAAQGLTTDEVSERLRLAPKTVNNNLSAAYERLGTRNLVQAVLQALHYGLIDVGRSN